MAAGGGKGGVRAAAALWLGGGAQGSNGHSLVGLTPHAREQTGRVLLNPNIA